MSFYYEQTTLAYFLSVWAPIRLPLRVAALLHGTDWEIRTATHARHRICVQFGARVPVTWKTNNSTNCSKLPTIKFLFSVFGARRANRFVYGWHVMCVCVFHDVTRYLKTRQKGSGAMGAQLLYAHFFPHFCFLVFHSACMQSPTRLSVRCFHFPVFDDARSLQPLSPLAPPSPVWCHLNHPFGRRIVTIKIIW